MTEYQFLLDDGRGADLMTETVEAGDDAEAELLGRMRLSAAPSLQRIIIMRRAFEVAPMAARTAVGRRCRVMAVLVWSVAVRVLRQCRRHCHCSCRAVAGTA